MQRLAEGELAPSMGTGLLSSWTVRHSCCNTASLQLAQGKDAHLKTHECLQLVIIWANCV